MRVQMSPRVPPVDKDVPGERHMRDDKAMTSGSELTFYQLLDALRAAHEHELACQSKTPEQASAPELSPSKDLDQACEHKGHSVHFLVTPDRNSSVHHDTSEIPAPKEHCAAPTPRSSKWQRSLAVSIMDDRTRRSRARSEHSSAKHSVFGSPEMLDSMSNRENEEQDQQEQQEQQEEQDRWQQRLFYIHVDASDDLVQNSNWLQRKMHHLIHHPYWDMLMGVAILLNVAMLGVETEMRLNHARASDVLFSIQAIDFSCLFLYTLEIILRFFTSGCKTFKSPWIRFDILLVLLGIADLFIHAILAGDVEVLDKIMIARTLRVFRIVRMIRLMHQFRVLWILVNGLFRSMSTLLWTFVLIFSIIYAFAILGLEVISPDDDVYSEEYNALVRQHFCQLGDTMLTLLQGVTLDSVGSIYRPIISENPVLFFYFITFILLVSVSLMNLVTAIMVESALDQSGEDKEMKRMVAESSKKKRVQELQVLLEQIDTDQSGNITLDELMDAPEHLLRVFQEFMDVNQRHVVFEALDYEGTGEVGIEEFCEGLYHFTTSNMEQFSLWQQGRLNLKLTSASFDQLRRVADHLGAPTPRPWSELQGE